MVRCSTSDDDAHEGHEHEGERDDKQLPIDLPGRSSVASEIVDVDCHGAIVANHCLPVVRSSYTDVHN